MTKCFSVNEFFKQIPELQNQRNKRVAAYTAIFGDYDKLKEPEFIDSGVDYFCFTDNKALISDNWNLIFLPHLFRDPRLSARALKILSHKTLMNYDFSVWVDGSCGITHSIEDFVFSCCNGENICAFEHKNRGCIYKEARTCRLKGKDDPRVIKNQMHWYKSVGYPKDNGLIESTILVRRNNEEDVRTLNEEWWRIVDSYSNRDQLSFNFVVWKYDIKHKVLGGSQLIESYFNFKPHSRMTFYSRNGRKINCIRSVLSDMYLKLRLTCRRLRKR